MSEEPISPISQLAAEKQTSDYVNGINISSLKGELKRVAAGVIKVGWFGGGDEFIRLWAPDLIQLDGEFNINQLRTLVNLMDTIDHAEYTLRIRDEKMAVDANLKALRMPPSQ